MDVVVRRQNSVFKDPSKEINDLIGRIKYDTKILSSELDDLELFLTHNKKQVGESQAEHSKHIVINMKEQLVGEVNVFKSILQVRFSS